MIGDWLWSTVWTEQNYRAAMADSACYNMFVEAIMSRLAVIAQWTQIGQWKTIFNAGERVPTGQNANFSGVDYGIYNKISYNYGRDWYKGAGETMMKTTTNWGWPYLQFVVASIAQYFVRTLDQNGNTMELDGYPIIPMVGNFGPSTPVYNRHGTVIRQKYKFQFPYPNGFTRKYSREINKTDAAGDQGEQARLIATKPSGNSKDTKEWNDWGMHTWFFRKDGFKWKHDPTIKNADIVEDVGLIQKCDLPGPWILNDLREAINQLSWTYANGDYQPRLVPNQRFQYHFHGSDKFQLRSDSGTLNDLVVNNNAGPIDSIRENRFEVYDAFFPTIFDTYTNFYRGTGIMPAEAYRSGVISTNFGLIFTDSPGDPTGKLQESWPFSSYFNFVGKYRGTTIKYDPLWVTPNSEGIPRQIEFYKPAQPFNEHCRKVGVSPTGTSWNDNYGGSDLLAPDRGTLGVVKWDFKYSRRNRYATWNGFSNAFLS